MATVYLLAKVDGALSAPHKSALEANLAESYATKWRSIGNGSYLVAADENPTTSGVATSVGITDGKVGAFVVTQMKPYYGWADSSIWEWANSFDG